MYPCRRHDLHNCFELTLSQTLQEYRLALRDFFTARNKRLHLLQNLLVDASLQFSHIRIGSSGFTRLTRFSSTLSSDIDSSFAILRLRAESPKRKERTASSVAGGLGCVYFNLSCSNLAIPDLPLLKASI